MGNPLFKEGSPPEGGQVSALLLAAGESGRMGRSKALLPFGGETLLEFQLHTLASLPEIGEVIVVVGHRKEELLPLIQSLPKARAVENPDYPQGPASSIKRGLAALKQGTQAILILGVDQPRPRGVLQALVEEHLRGRYPITVPTYRGKRGHPVLFSSTLLPALLSISEEKQGLREVMARYRGQTREVPLDSPAVLININTPEDYREALKAFAELSPEREDKAGSG